ncbi:thiolase family protein [Sphingobium algorifonticola]|uniref:Thiolase family protein n=1 Tax=Sphingobium algorifonticola TaxID=2008318 RepID=A0A437J9V0_9SPHN|nr:thiolase family protein [Sphingobium algorifonticola]RVT42271.1 thiolase family protein [Sphingobium algorifonticola]
MIGNAIAWIAYGSYWSTPFVRWQGAFAELHSLRFATWTGRQALEKRNVDLSAIDFGVLGFTVPQQGSFYGLPWVMGELGAPHVAGPSVMQACATSARAVTLAAQEVADGSARAALVITCDRVSNGPHIYYPAPSAPGGTGRSENWILDNFARDPFAQVAMVETAENVAARWGIDRAEQDDVVLMRAAQYADALADDHAFHRRFMDLPFAVPDPAFRKVMRHIDGDIGVQPADPGKLRALHPVREGGTVTYGGQTHPADGNAGIIVATRDRARALARTPDIEVAILGVGQARVEPAFMPAAPVPATQRALDRAGVTMAQIDAVKSHNPFAVNDIVFARETGFPLEKMNNFGCSLVWGHPQGPTGLRAIIELIEELAMRGGGRGLYQGCAAGDSAMAVVIEVSG